MNEASTLLRTAEGMKLAISSAKDAQYVPGRRQFFQYRDLGVTEATGGKMRAQVTSAKSAMDRATGRHYHTCDMQFVYILKGWVDLEFAGGEKRGSASAIADDFPAACHTRRLPPPMTSSSY